MLTNLALAFILGYIEQQNNKIMCAKGSAHILGQINVEINLTPKLVVSVVLAETLNGFYKVKVNRNARFGECVLVLQVRVDFYASDEQPFFKPEQSFLPLE